jgi:hypothetical protein
MEGKVSMSSSKNLSLTLIDEGNSYNTEETWITTINITVLLRFSSHKYHLIQLEFLSRSTTRALLLFTIELEEITYERGIFRVFLLSNGRNKNNNIFLTVLFFIRLSEYSFFVDFSCSW